MIWRSALGACLMCASLSFAQPTRRPFTFATVHEFETREGLAVDLNNPAGHIEIRPGTSSVLRIIENIVIPATDSSYAMMFLDEAVITLSHSNDRISVEAMVRRPPHKRAAFGGLLDLRLRTRARVHFEVYVPTGVHVVAKTTDGKIDASQMDISMDLASTSGPLNLTSSTNVVTMTTSTGAIGIIGSDAHITVTTSAGPVSTVASDGVLSVVSQTGAISVHDWNGDAQLESGSGSIETARTAGTLASRTRSGRCIINTHRGALSVNSSSGPVTLVGSPSNDVFEIVTISGDIGVQLGALVPRRLEAQSRRGAVASTLNLVWNKQSTRQLRGNWADGAGSLYLETTEGRIRLSRGT